METNQEQNNPLSEKLIISSSPHLFRRETTSNIMWLVSLALLPSTIFGIFTFGFHAALVVIASILTAILTEALVLKVRNRRISLDDGSAVLTGLLIGLNMPPSVPLYIPIISTIFAIALVKQAFGGLGENWANPAIAARVFALFAWSKKMAIWQAPMSYDSATVASSSYDVVTTATPLGAIKSAIMEGSASKAFMTHSNPLINFLQGPLQIYGETVNKPVTHLDLFLGDKGGCIGEISIFLLLIGALYLIYRRIVTLDIPVTYILTAGLIAWVFGGLQFGKGLFHGDFLFHILTGGLVLGAFFMATDMVTTPITVKGRIIFGFGCGVITMIIRLMGGLPEGVSLSILFMNMLTPTIDRFIKVKPMGYIKA